MGRNVFFSQAVKSEQNLYEDLIIESLQIYGQETYYLPREILDTDNILGEDTASKYDDAYMIEAYIDNPEGFEGGGDLFQKFGIEIRDECVFTISKRRWESSVGTSQGISKPNEGDIIYLPLSNSYFEITYVDSKTPFYQLSNLPVYKLTCALYEYNDEAFDTGITDIDSVAGNWAYGLDIKILDTAMTGGFLVGEILSQTLDDTTTPDVTVYGTMQSIEIGDGFKIYKLTNIGATGTTDVKDFNLAKAIVGLSSGAEASSIDTIYQIDDANPDTNHVFPNDRQSQNVAFEVEADEFLDFSEANPFGEPGQ